MGKIYTDPSSFIRTRAGRWLIAGTLTSAALVAGFQVFSDGDGEASQKATAPSSRDTGTGPATPGDNTRDPRGLFAFITEKIPGEDRIAKQGNTEDYNPDSAARQHLLKLRHEFNDARTDAKRFEAVREARIVALQRPEAVDEEWTKEMLISMTEEYARRAITELRTEINANPQDPIENYRRASEILHTLRFVHLDEGGYLPDFQFKTLEYPPTENEKIAGIRYAEITAYMNEIAETAASAALTELQAMADSQQAVTGEDWIRVNDLSIATYAYNLPGEKKEFFTNAMMSAYRRIYALHYGESLPSDAESPAPQ